MESAIPKPPVNLRIMFDGSTLYRLPGHKRTARFTPIQQQLALMDDIGAGLSRDTTLHCTSADDALAVASLWVTEGVIHPLNG